MTRISIRIGWLLIGTSWMLMAQGCPFPLFSGGNNNQQTTGGPPDPGFSPPTDNTIITTPKVPVLGDTVAISLSKSRLVTLGTSATPECTDIALSLGDLDPTRVGLRITLIDLVNKSTPPAAALFQFQSAQPEVVPDQARYGTLTASRYCPPVFVEQELAFTLTAFALTAQGAVIADIPLGVASFVVAPPGGNLGITLTSDHAVIADSNAGSDPTITANQTDKRTTATLSGIITGGVPQPNINGALYQVQFSANDQAIGGQVAATLQSDGTIVAQLTVNAVGNALNENLAAGLFAPGVKTIKAKVTDNVGGTATGVLSLTVNPPLDVTVSAVPNGALVTLSAGASGGLGSFSFLWSDPSNGTLPGGSNNAQQFVNLTVIDINNPSSAVVTVTDSVGNVLAKRSPENQPLCPAPVVSAHPANVTDVTGVVSFTVAATHSANGGTLQYQWQRSADGTTFADIPSSAHFSGLTTTTLIINAPLVVGDTGFYRAHVFDGCGAAGVFSNGTAFLDATPPTVSGVVAGVANGTFGVGAVIPIQVTFDELVNVTGTPQITLETGGTDRVVNYTSGTGTNTLTFNYTVQAGDTSADLDYVATNSLALNGGTIRDAVGNNATLTLAAPGAAGSISDNQAVVIDTTVPTVSGVVAGVADGTYGIGAVIPIQVTFTKAVTVTNTPQITLETGGTDQAVNYTSGSTTTTLTFNYTVQAGDTSADLDYVATNSLALNGGTIVQTGLTAGTNDATLTLAAPGAAGSISDNQAVVIDTTVPTVSGVVANVADGTYGIGAVIPIQVTFTKAVTVTNVPQITLETGGSDQVVNYTSGSTTTTLTFNYTVQAGDTSADLDYVATNSLALNGGTIVQTGLTAGTNNATLTLASPAGAGSISDNQAVVIDGVVPAVSGVVANIADGTYGIGAVIPIQVTFTKAVTVTNVPQITLETGGTDQVVNYTSGSTTTTLTFNYTVQAGDTSADLDYVATNSLALNGGTIVQTGLTAGTNNATLTLASPNAAGSIGDNQAVVIDGIVPTVSGVVANVADATYGIGAVIPIQVTFTKAVTVTNVPQITLETGGSDQVVNYTSGSTTTTLTFNYTVQAGDTSADLDYVATNSLALNGGTIVQTGLTAGTNNATLTLASPNAAGSISDNQAVVIDAVVAAVSGVVAGVANGTFGIGAVIPIQVTFTKAVTVTNVPQITLETGGTDQVVNYTSGSTTTTLTFNYTVQAGDTSADLDYVATNSLALNGGTIQDSVGNNATLTLASPNAAGSISDNQAVVIDTTVPTVSGVVAGVANGTFGIGAVIPIQVTFTKAVTVTNVPQITLETGGTDEVVDYTSGSTTTTLTFNYTVQAGDTSADLDYVATNSLALNGGTIVQTALTAGTNNATLTLASPNAAGSISDNQAVVIDTTVPTVSGVVAGVGNGTYGIGALIPIQVTFTKAVTVTNVPQITLETGGTDEVVDYTSGSTTTTLTFNYTVQAGDTSADLDYVATNSLALNGGTIVQTGLTAGTNNATLTLASPNAAGSISDNQAVVIDGVVPAVTDVSSTATDGPHTTVGVDIDIQIVFDKAVVVDTGGGTPVLALNTAPLRSATYQSGTGTTTLTFRYTTVSGDVAGDLDYVATNSLTLGGGSIIQDSLTGGTNNATLTLASPGAAGSISDNQAIVVNVP